MSVDLSVLLPDLPANRDGWRWGTVTQVNPVRVRLDGDAAPLLVTPDVLGIVGPGDRVWCHLVGHRLVVHDAGGATNVRPFGQTQFSHTSLPDDYPAGVTVITVEDASGTTWPASWATVVTTKVVQQRITQTLTNYQGKVWTRAGTGTGNTWSPWVQSHYATAPFSGTTDGSGYLTVTHGLGYTPQAVGALIASHSDAANGTSGADFPMFAYTDSITATTFRLSVTGNRSGAFGTYTSQPVRGIWIAI